MKSNLAPENDQKSIRKEFDLTALRLESIFEDKGINNDSKAQPASDNQI